MFTHRVKSAMGLRLPQGAQEGVAAIYTHTKKSSHSNSLRASLDDEINPSFRLKHPLPPPPPAASGPAALPDAPAVAPLGPALLGSPAPGEGSPPPSGLQAKLARWPMEV